MNQLAYFRPDWIATTTDTLEADLAIYGGTAAGVIAAQTAATRGLSVVLLHPGHTLGGMTTGGLGETDAGKKAVIGGASRQFYRDMGREKGRDEEEWKFEPHVAQKIIDGYAAHPHIEVRKHQFLQSVELEERAISSVSCLGGLKVRAKFWIDATYEGDLMAKAGVSFHVGRESNSVYDETINGVQVHEKHQFSHFVDPYVEPGNPQSGLLPGINGQDVAAMGSGDGRIQSYNFRVCMTNDPDLRVDWRKPDGYDEREYELASRWFNAEKDKYNDQIPNYPGHPTDLPRKFDALRARTANGYYKTDTNNHGAVSSDFIGRNYAWPEAGYAEREEIFQAHVNYQRGLYWFIANDAAIPARYREAYASFGLAGDEFAATEHWPHQLYVREARRMIGDYVMTEHDTQHTRQCDDAVGMGSYALDSHNCQRFVRDGRVLNEGDVQMPPKAPYAISYRSIVPRAGECPNLLVPVCLSSSHIAFGSIRMEPVFMVLGESAAVAAHLAMENRTSVQEVNYAELRAQLVEAKQVLGE